MKSSKSLLNDAINKDEPIRKGGAFSLSVETTAAPAPHEPGTNAQVHNPTSAQEHKSTSAPDTKKTKVTRTSHGLRMRDDILKHCKRLALEKEQPLYLVIEDALAEYLARHGITPKNIT